MEYQDEQLSKLLREGRFELPDSYEIRFQKTLETIIKKPRKRNAFIFHTKVAVAAMCLLALFVSVSAGAAVNRYWQRMKELDSTEIARYNSDVQSVEREADEFSRPLSTSESERMDTLRQEYETAGRFPSGSLLQMKMESDIAENALCFCVENSTFYLPNRVLSDEELLQIVDFMEKREYSVQQGNKARQQESADNEKIQEKEAVEIAKEALSAIYSVDCSGAKTRTEFDVAHNGRERMSSYIVDMRDPDWDFDATVQIDSQTGEVSLINIDTKSKENFRTGIPVRMKQYEEYVAQIEDIYEELSGEGIRNLWIYYNYRKDNTLNRGNVEYVVEEKDGSGYVFYYSVNADTVYDIQFLWSVDDYFKAKRRNVKVRKKLGVKGIKTKKVKIK